MGRRGKKACECALFWFTLDAFGALLSINAYEISLDACAHAEMRS